MGSYKEFIKYPKIKRLGDSENRGILTNRNVVIVQEKIDGANFRFMLKNGRLVFGSRNQFLGLEETNTFNKQFQRCIDYIKRTVDKSALQKLSNEKGSLIFFGEDCIKHTINYDWDRIPPFLGFDVYSFKKKTFFPFSSVDTMFYNIGLPTVPLILITDEKKDIQKLVKGINELKSEYYDGYAEGIVIKNYKRQLFAKVKHKDFAEKNREVFGYTKKHAKDDSEKFIAMYGTNARIEKMIFTFIDLGKKLDMKLMQLLPRQVYRDIFTEEYMDIAFTNWVLDLKKIRKILAHRCAIVLNQMIINNELG